MHKWDNVVKKPQTKHKIQSQKANKKYLVIFFSYVTEFY